MQNKILLQIVKYEVKFRDKNRSTYTFEEVSNYYKQQIKNKFWREKKINL